MHHSLVIHVLPRGGVLENAFSRTSVAEVLFFSPYNQPLAEYFLSLISELVTI